MKADINGIVYDTEDAIEIEYWKNVYPEGHSKAWRETLYRSRDGQRSFLVGQGGPDTAFANGPEIVPLTGQDLALLYQRKYGVNFG